MRTTTTMTKQIVTSAAIPSKHIKCSYFSVVIIGVILFFLPSLFNSLPLGQDWGGALCAQNVSINPTGTAGDPSSMLDVNAGNKGMLIPRVGLTSTTDIVTIALPVTSLLVYNTATAGTSPNNVVPGFYYWGGLKWSPLSSPEGSVGLLAFADFYALMPPDNSVTVGAGAAVEFPNAGPTSGVAITALTNTLFQLSAIGTYMVSWQVSVVELGQLVLELNGAELLNTVVGRATGATQIVGNRLITTVIPNSILRVINPFGNTPALTITQFAGGASPVSASLVITRLQ